MSDIRIKRGGRRDTVVPPVGDEEAMVAGECVRAFERGAGYARFVALLETERENMHRVLYKSADSVSRERLAEVSGAVKALEMVYTFFDQILREAQTARERNRSD